MIKKYTFRTGLVALVLGLSAQFAHANSWFNDVKNERINSVQKAVNRGQDPNVLNDDGHPAIIYAVREDSPKVYMFLANHHKTDVNLANRYDETPLMYAAIIGDIDFAKVLIKRGAQVNRLGWAPLHYAASRGQTKMVEFLLSQGAFPNAPAADGSSPIFLAVKARRNDTVKALLAAGADPYAVNQQYKSAMDIAKEMKLDSIVRLLEGK